MSKARSEAVAAFIRSTPHGELNNVLNDIKQILPSYSEVLEDVQKDLQAFHEDQFTEARVDGITDPVIISRFNSLGESRYVDFISGKAFTFNYSSQKCSDVEPYQMKAGKPELIKLLHQEFKAHADDHYPSHSIAVYPVGESAQISLLLVASKNTPKNFWSGRWRCSYIYDRSEDTLDAKLNVDVHYYEAGNVRLLTDQPASRRISLERGPDEAATAKNVVRAIAGHETKYQNQLNEAFEKFSENAFKSLRRQLPITRQKIEWSKIAGYTLGHELSSVKNPGEAHG